jgi:O-antigen biosynthesis protein
MRQPRVSLVMPTYNTDPRLLREAIDSVKRQRYPNWELRIVDDGSTRSGLRRVLEHAAADARVEVRFLAENRGISSATNAGIEMCSGELIGFIDHDDALTEDALLAVAEAVEADPEAEVLYTDQDKITAGGTRTEPFLKPDWSPIYALGAMYVGHLLVVRRDLIDRVGGFDPDYDTIQDFEFLLRTSEQARRIHHIPRIVYHWRAVPGSIAAGTEEKPGVDELQARAVNAHLARRGIAARAVPNPSIPHRIRLEPEPLPTPPRVAVVILEPELPRGGRDGAGCLAELRERSSYPNVEFILAGSGNALGPAAAETGAEYLLFIDARCEVRERDWIERLLMYASLPGVGAVGPLLVTPAGRVLQAGIALGLDDPATPVMRDYEAGGDGYYGTLSCAREVAAVGGECMLVARDAFAESGGFKPAYRAEFADVDLCQELRRRGLGIVYAPGPQVISHELDAERRARFDVIDRGLFVDSWYDQLTAGDPYFNSGFARASADFTVAAA